jgi:hypothetical protein
VTELQEEITGAVIKRDKDKLFKDVKPGFYRMR